MSGYGKEGLKTIATLLSGGEGVGVGARAAGLRHLWGLEIDDGIAQAARDNGFNVMTADVLDVDPAGLERPDVLHASPECRNASQAKSNGEETKADVEVGNCIVRYVETLRPRVFTLENVYPYRHFEAFERIVTALGRLGYFVHFGNLNAADFGVPQTRKRLILRAVHGGLVPMLPPAEPWRGWYEAVEDLIPTLPESRFAPWQLRLLPEALHRSAIFSNQNSHDREGNCYGTVYREEDEPAMTVRKALLGARAFIVTGQYGKPSGAVDRPPQVRGGGEPSFTVTASNKGDWRAFVVDGQNAGSDRITVRDGGSPMFTITNVAKAYPRAWLSEGRVVSVTPRALARLQSFPDGYELPENKSLASRIVGNAVPPAVYRKIVEAMVER
ncbi:MAG: DNA cytosine methyltransferase [Anaerolineae bacterium]|jgi:DNA (cytosine-5)-methyltransferase 1